MLFTTLTFLVFLPIVRVLWAAAPAPLHRPVLLIASYVFYMTWGPLYGLLLAGTSLLGWGAGVLIAREIRPRLVVTLTVAAHLGVLAFYKYLGFLMENLVALVGVAGLHLRLAPDGPDGYGIVLPLGISFFTFQGIAYVVDVYRDRRALVRSALDYFLFLAWFPQLVAGPIVRASQLVHQLRQRTRPPSDRMLDGAALAIRGFFKKAAVADNLGLVVDQAFSTHAAWDTTSAWLFLLAYAFQIYFDFSGYTDIARGVSRCFGIELPVNFRNPYAAASITEFWRRWHITLSSWLRDYLYVPLGGNRAGRVRQYRNLVLTMLLGGLWHGASWNFVLWGGWHGALLAVHKLLRARLPAGLLRRLDASRAWQAVSVAGTFGLVVLSWVPFRAQGLGQTGDILRTMLVDPSFGPVPPELPGSMAVVALGTHAAYRALRWLAGLRPGLERAIGRAAADPALATAALVHVALMTFALSVNGTSPFIYFQF